MAMNTTPGNHGPTAVYLGKNDNGTLTYVSLDENFQSIHLYTSLHSQAIKCQIRINDPVDLLGQLEPTGEELLIVAWSTPNFHTNRPEHKERLICFRVTKIENVTVDKNNLKRQSYTIHGLHELAYIQSFGSIDNHFSGTIHDAAKKFFEKGKDRASEIDSQILYPKKCNLTVDEVDGVVDFIIPSETPFDAMTYLQGWASDKSKNQTNIFLFYQDLEGYNFRNLDSLIMHNYPPDFNHNRYRYDPIINRQALANPLKSDEILQIQQVSRFNAYKHAKDGNLHTSVAKVDYLTKTVERESMKFDQNDGIERMQTLYPVDIEYLNKFAKDSNSTDWIYVNSGLPNYIDNSHSHLSKKVYGTVFFNNIVQILIPGNSSLDIGQTLGIRISRPSLPTNTGEESKLDPDIDGNYLIKDIVHSFTPQSYYQLITLCRTGKEKYA